MMVSQRHRQLLAALEEKPDISVKELARLLCVSEPTVRRDLTELAQQGILTKVYGGAILHRGAADREIPFFFRNQEKSAVKSRMGARAAELVHDGMVVFLDGSTSAYHLVPYLARYKDLLVITSGAKTAVALAEANIRTFCTGGQMITNSFSYVGEDANATISRYNADIAFFSCRGLSDDKIPSDNSAEENEVRRTMMRNSKKRSLLCDSKKLGRVFLNNLGRPDEIDEIITE